MPRHPPFSAQDDAAHDIEVASNQFEASFHSKSAEQMPEDLGGVFEAVTGIVSVAIIVAPLRVIARH